MRPSIVVAVGLSLVPLLLNDVHAAQISPDAVGLVSQLTQVIPLLQEGRFAERATQVMTVNLANLFILALGKGILTLLMLVTSPTGLGTMFLKRSGEFRIADDDPELFVTDTDIQWGAQYMKSDLANDWTCMKRLFCEEPNRAETYLNVGRLLVKAADWTTKFGLYNFTTGRHEELIQNLDEAVNYGQFNASHAEACRAKYKCNMSSDPDVTFKRGADTDDYEAYVRRQ